MTHVETIHVLDTGTAPALAAVVCGIDGSPEAAEAARQTALLVPPDARMELVGVIHAGLVESVASVMPARTPEPERRLRKDAWEALELASRDVPAGIEVTSTLRTGPAAAMLESEAARHDAELIAVGSHGQGRLAGRLLGSVATRLVHEAACSVLVARPAPAETFPRTIIVGVDRSEPSLRALALGRELSRRTGAPLDPVHVLDSSPAPALVDRATSDDLIVVGPRGVHGLRSLGSVSEAVAHRAPCSVLVVR